MSSRMKTCVLKIVCLLCIMDMTEVYSQEIRQSIRLTDSCRACKAAMIDGKALHFQEILALSKFVIELNDSIAKYQDSLSYSYGWNYVNTHTDLPAVRSEWQQKIDHFRSQQKDLEDKEKGPRHLMDSFNRVQRPYYKSLEVLEKRKDDDTLAVLEYCSQNNGLDLGFNHPRLKKSRIATLPVGDSMNFYFFTWYTVKAHWEDVESSRNRFAPNHSRENDNLLNGDLAHGVYPYYDSLGYNRVWFLRKVTMKRLPCFWQITAYEDIYFTEATFVDAQLRYDSMMKDGRERFTFTYEATFADCMTNEEVWEYTYPVDFLEGERYVNEYRRISDLMWRFAELELLEKKAAGFRNTPGGTNYTMNYMTNNFMVIFSDGTHLCRHIPYWFYVRKYYNHYWTPG